MHIAVLEAKYVIFFFFLQILMSYKLNEKNLSVLCLAYDGKK